MTAIAHRRTYIGGSEVAALFNVHPRLTIWELFQRKIGALPEPDLSDNIRVRCGVALEAAVARLIADIHGLKIRKGRFRRHKTVRGLGATTDYEVEQGGGFVPLELKCVDGAVFRDEWLADDEEGLRHDQVLTCLEPPLSISLQVQLQIDVMAATSGYVGLLVAGNKPFLATMPRHEPTIAAIRARAAAFWARVTANEPPPVVGEDRDALAALYGQKNGLPEPLDLTGDNRFGALCAELEAAKAGLAGAKSEVAALEAELLDKLKGAECATDGEWWAKWPVIHRKGYSVAAGTYRRLTISRRKEKAA